MGPRHIRGTRGVVKFYSYSTVDVTGHTAFTSQFNNKQSMCFCMHLIETWRVWGFPKYRRWTMKWLSPAEEDINTTSPRLSDCICSLASCAFQSSGEIGRNAYVESFNALWQERVL